MRDLFDEFLEELRRRQANAEKPESPDSTGTPADGEPAASDETRGQPEGGEREAAQPEGDIRADEPRAEPGAAEGSSEEEPEPIRMGDRGRRWRGGGGPPRRPRRRVGGPNDGGGPWARVRRFGGRFGVALLIVLILVLISLLGVGLDLWTDAIWFTSVGYESVFWTRILTQVFLFAGVFAISLLVLLGNLWLAARLSPPPDPTHTGSFQSLFDRLAESATQAGGPAGRRRRFDRYDSGEEPPFGPFGGLGGPRAGGGPPLGPRPVVVGGEDIPDLTPIAGWVLAAIAVLAALAAGGTASSSWETIQLWLHGVPFAVAGQPAVTDPVFGRDISFFLFDLPFIRLVQSVVNALLLGALLISLARYVVGALRGSLVFSTQIRVHLAVLAGLYLLSVAAGYQLDKFELVYSARGVATGVSYTDANAQFFALDALTVIAAFAAAFLIGGAFTRMIWPLGLAVGVWFIASIVLGQLYPSAVQQFVVKPDERAKESTYISYNIQMTDVAYKLNGWFPATNYGGEAPLTQQAITNDQATFDNARVWDYRPLQQTLDQLQTVRTYYEFYDVDTDRYMLNGQLRQVMLSARELKPGQGASWVNQKITFTHGVGLALVPVNGATTSGQPNLLIRDLPPVSSGGAPQVKQFRIYFGEEASDYVIVDARQAEFDYPVGSNQSGDTNGGQTTSWQGTTGIRLENTLTRLLFALRFRDLNMLISDQVTAGSQLLFHQNLQDRLNLVAPFLVYDKDPYLVITNDGRLVWMQDAYTISDRFPNAQYMDTSTLPVNSNLANVSFNYVRNSVKVVIDAYDGRMTFYAADPTDPILRAYEGVFPSLFQPMSAMPTDLQSHIRVPEELFNVQTRMFERYHVQNPDVFYSGQDLWTVPAGQSSTQGLPAEAYYVVMRLPGESNPEFLLLQPMVPRDRPNMIAWVAARNDGANYGQVKVFQFPENTSVLGPVQIEAQIAANPTISAQVSLWDQAGSKVTFGNLIVMPVGDSIIYLQPLFLASSSANPLPELQKVILATSGQIVWGDNLAQALQLLLAGGGVGPSPSPSTGPSPSPGASPTAPPSVVPGQTPPAGNIQALVNYANAHFDAAQQALRNGDFSRYGQEIALVQQALRELQATVGSSFAPGSPSPSPSASH